MFNTWFSHRSIATIRSRVEQLCNLEATGVQCSELYTGHGGASARGWVPNPKHTDAMPDQTLL